MDLQALFSRALAEEQAGRLEQAKALYQAVLAQRDDAVSAHVNLGNLLQRLGNLQKAAAHFQRACQLMPQLPQPWGNLGAVLLELNQPEEAAEACRRALALQSGPEAWNNLGNALIALGDLGGAEEAFRRSLPFDKAAANLAALLYDLERFAEAAQVAQGQTSAEVLGNLGNILITQGKLAEAEPCFRQALALAPDDAQRHLNFAFLLLKQGRFAEGWAEYEWRRRLKGRWSPPPELPEWQGEPLAGKRLLLTAEQGLGDTLQFCRYAKVIDGDVVMRVQAPLVRLLADLGAVISYDDPLPDVDYHKPLMSLPGLLGNVTPCQPYLRADPRPLNLPGRKVGLCWAGDPRPYSRVAHLMDRRRSLALAQFAPLAEIPGLSWVSLQKGEAARQAPPDGMVLYDCMSEMTDMADTAALVAGLDLVITADTAMAHLAGALGKPVWILSRFDGCWRWGEEGEGTPWYPTARLFRQSRLGDWDSVIGEVRDALIKIQQ